jgi:hypothetical protein
MLSGRPVWNRRLGLSVGTLLGAFLLAVLLILPATGSVVSHGSTYLNFYSVSSSGVPTAVTPLTVSGHAAFPLTLKNLSISNISDGSTGDLGVIWLLVNSSYHCISISAQDNQTNDAVWIFGAACKFTTGQYGGDWISAFEAIYIAPPNLTGFVPNIGDSYYYNFTGPLGTALVKACTAISSVASTYSGSPNSTIRALGTQEGRIGTAISLMRSLLPSNVTGLSVLGTGASLTTGEAVWNGGNPNVNDGVNPLYAYGYGGEEDAQLVAYCTELTALSILGVALALLLLGASCAGGDVISCLLIAAVSLVGGAVFYDGVNACVALLEGTPGSGFSLDVVPIVSRVNPASHPLDVRPANAS